MAHGSDRVMLSVVISTWNNAERLDMTLSALANCRTPHGLIWELVVVNNNCTDDTNAVIGRHVETLPVVRVDEPRQGLSRARNAGISSASGEALLFTDDDVTPCEGWLAEYATAFEKMGPGFFFGGPIESDFEGLPPAPEFLAVAPRSVRGQDYGDRGRPLAEYEEFISANWAARKEDILSAGCFDESLGLDPSLGRVRVGEEGALMNRLRSNGLVPWYLPGARLRHFVPAAKCTVEHIAERLAASEYNRARDHSREYRGLRVASCPPRLPLTVAKRAVLAGLERLITGRAGMKYLAWRRAVGYAQGFRDGMDAGGPVDSEAGGSA